MLRKIFNKAFNKRINAKINELKNSKLEPGKDLNVEQRSKVFVHNMRIDYVIKVLKEL